jgi:hypothetical protein
MTSQFLLARPWDRRNQLEYKNLPVPTGSPTQPSEPIGDKTRTTSVAQKRAIFVLVWGETGRSSKGVVGREPRGGKR